MQTEVERWWAVDELWWATTSRDETLSRVWNCWENSISLSNFKYMARTQVRCPWRTILTWNADYSRGLREIWNAKKGKHHPGMMQGQKTGVTLHRDQGKQEQGTLLRNEEFQSSKVYLRSIKNDNHAASKSNDTKLWRNSPSPSPPAPFPSVPPKHNTKGTTNAFNRKVAPEADGITVILFAKMTQTLRLQIVKTSSQTHEFKFDAFVLREKRVLLKLYAELTMVD